MKTLMIAMLVMASFVAVVPTAAASCSAQPYGPELVCRVGLIHEAVLEAADEVVCALECPDA